MLPDKPLVAQLEYTHNEYDYYRDTWQTIQDIRDGAATIKKKINTYCPKRPGEAEDIYTLRKAKATWTPVAATAIREFVVKLLAAPLHLEGINDNDDFWVRLKDDTNGKGRDQADLLTQLFSSLLYFGRVTVAVDRPVLPVLPRSKFEEKAVGALPKIVVYDPLTVINWGDGWLVTRELSQVAQPLAKPKTIANWRIWTSVSINTYSKEVKLNLEGTITEVKNKNGWIPVGYPEATADLVSTVEHGFGQLPLTTVELPTELWTGNNIYQKQLQHFAIESSWTDAGIMAGTIQRVFTPTPPVPSNDPSVVYDEPDYSQVKSDNAHVLIGNGFQFVESSGSAIASLTSQLETIENQIRAIVSMTSNTVDKSKAVASGAAKAIDNEPLEATMKAYGQIMSSLYKDILILVAKAVSKPEGITVNGLDNYTVQSLDDMIAQTITLLPALEAIPPTALKLWFGKLSNLISGSRSALLDDKINAELDTIWSSGLPESLKPVLEVTKEEPKPKA